MKKSIIADFILVIIALIWGTTFVVVQNAIANISPYAFNGWRFLFAVIVLLLFVGLFKRHIFRSFNKGVILSGFVLGGLLFLGYIFQTVGLLYTTSSKAAFITGLSVVLVPVFSFFFLKVVPTKLAIIGVIIATVGLYTLSIVKDFSIHFGDLLVFICALGFGLQIVVTAAYTNKYSAFALTIVQLLTVSLLSFISGIIFDGFKETFQLSLVLKPTVLPAVLFTAVFATAFAYLLQTALQRFTTPTHVGLIFIMEPVFAALTAVVWQHELMSLNTEIGAALILIGMLLAEVPVVKRKKRKQTT